MAGLGAEDKWPRLGPRFRAPSSVKTAEVSIKALSSVLRGPVKGPSRVFNDRVCCGTEYFGGYSHRIAVDDNNTECNGKFVFDGDK